MMIILNYKCNYVPTLRDHKACDNWTQFLQNLKLHSENSKKCRYFLYYFLTELSLLNGNNRKYNKTLNFVTKYCIEINNLLDDVNLIIDIYITGKTAIFWITVARGYVWMAVWQASRFIQIGCT